MKNHIQIFERGGAIVAVRALKLWTGKSGTSIELSEKFMRSDIDISHVKKGFI